MIEESIHVVCKESIDGRLSSLSFKELMLKKYDDDDDDDEQDEVKAKSHTKHKEPPRDSNHDHNVSPTNEELHPRNEEESSSIAPREEREHEPRKGYKYKSSHPLENLLTDISTGIKTKFSLREFCIFSSFVSPIELKNHLEALDDPN